MTLSIERITDYGAEPNPEDPDLATARRNLMAVRDAANAAGPGGVVYVPEGDFYVGNDGYELLLFGPREPRGISIAGAGPTKSKLALTKHMPDTQSHTLMFYHDDGGAGHGSVRISDIELHGNAYQLNNLVDAGRSSRAVDLQSDDITGGTWTFTNVLWSEWYSSAVRLREEECTFDRCTFRECGIQSRRDGASGHAIETHCPRGKTITAKDCKFLNIASFAFNWRYNDGTAKLENCYAEGTGTGLVKLSAGGELDIANVYHKAKTEFLEENVRGDSLTDSNGDPFHGRHLINRITERGDVEPTVTLNNVEGHDYDFTAIKFRDTPASVKGDLIAIHNACRLRDAAAVQDETTAMRDVDIDRLSVHGTDGDVFATPDSDGSIGTLRRDDNSGDLGDTGGIVVRTEEVGADPYEPVVPSRSEVGSDSLEATEPSAGREPAVFATDFADASLDSFTPRWASSASDWVLSSTESNFGERVLELAPDSAGRHALSWDDVGEATDVEVLALVRVPSDSDDLSDWCRSYVRGTDKETAYFSALNDDSGFSVHQYQDGSSTTVETSTIPEPDTWYWTRFRVEEEDIGLKHWRYGDSEPDAWHIQTTDSDITAGGWVGIGGFPSDGQQFDYLGVGVGGASPDVPVSDGSGPGDTLPIDGPSIFDAWTPQWASSQTDWSATAMSSNDDDAVLELAAESAGRHGLSWNSVGTAKDVDILGLVRVPRNDDSSSSWCRLYGRGAGTNGNETAYFTTFRDPFTFEIAKYNGGGSELLAAEDIDSPLDEWLFVRFNIESDRIRARYWPYGDSEPTEWNLEVSDTSIPDAGWVGVGGWSTDTQQWDYFSVATDGRSAPFADRDTAPSLSWETPSADTKVSESIALRLDATDREDDTGSLTVEYRVDGGEWTPTEYGSTSGYYQATWDTTAVADGTHSLEARVTDSAGNTANSTVSVITANDPTIEQFAVTDRGNPSWNRYDVDWTVADAGEDLDRVVTLLLTGGAAVSAETTEVSDGRASGTHSHRVRGDVDEIRLLVNDTSNRIETETRTL